MTDLAFATGVFNSYRAVLKFHAGKIATDIREGEVVQFDGQTIRINGVEHNYPELRAAIRVGWVVPENDNISKYRPKSSNVKVRPAVDTKKGKEAQVTITQDEQDMGPAVRKVSAPKEEVVSTPAFSREVKNADDSEREVGPSIRNASVKSGDPNNEDARPIGKVRTPAVTKTVISDGAQAAREAARLDNDPPPRAILASVKGNDIHAAEAEKVESIIDSLNPEDRARMIAEQRKAQAKAEAAATKPVEATTAPAPKAPKPAKSVEPKVSKPTTVEEVIIQGDEIDLGNGIKWDKNLHWRTRAKIAAEKYGDSPESLKAIIAVETPAVNALIKERMAALGKGPVE